MGNFKSLLVTYSPPVVIRTGRGGSASVTNAVTIPYHPTAIQQHSEGKIYIIGAYDQNDVYIPFDTERNKKIILGEITVCASCKKDIKRTHICAHCKKESCPTCGTIL